MQTNIAAEYKNDVRVEMAESVLRRCVHCGFCLATCPTYNLLGDELDSPRGRIYQIKQVLEGMPPSTSTQQHLDRCLTCRSCETTCPSGVEYGQLVDIGRSIVDEQLPRPFKDRLLRQLVKWVLPYPGRIGPLVKLGQKFRFLLPASIRRSVPPQRAAGVVPTKRLARHMLMLQGCVQPSMAPATNAAAARVLNRFDVSVEAIRAAGCCGAIHYHLSDHEKGLDFMRHNIDAWWPAIEAGAEAILITASGCGLMVKEYALALQSDPQYRDKAAKVSKLAKDPVEVVSELLCEEKAAELNLPERVKNSPTPVVAFHPPCTLQHGQQLPGLTEALLRRAGFTLTEVADAHLCCGSAGTYSIFQPDISARLQSNKITALRAGAPDVIATANIGCQLHLQSATELSVKHWLELLDEILLD